MTLLNYVKPERETELPHNQDGVWHPLLADELSDRAMAAVEGIIADLPDPSANEISDPSLAGGKSGISLFSSYLALTGLDDGENAAHFLEEAVEAIAARPMRPSLYSGFTGVAWATAHLQKQLGDADEETTYKALDEALLAHLSESPWRGDYDLISGLVGFGVYALERVPNPMAVEMLERVVERLDETAERNAEGITWLTPPELLTSWQREIPPNGYYNLGLAHGVPGVIALLGHAYAAGIARSQVEPLLEGAIDWLLAQKLPSNSHSMFPSWVGPSWAGPSIGSDECRLAWCYGDAGIAAALLSAARSAREPGWEREALEIAICAARRTPETAGVLDVSLCHGAAGLGHIFNRMYQATGAKQLKDAATFWFDRTLEMRRPEGGIGGFVALGVVNDERRWVADPGFLTGAAGLGLSLLSAITPIEPVWDRILLVS